MKIGGLEKITLIDYPGKVACMIYTIGCNFRCPYCHNPELVDETADVLSEEKIFEFLHSRKSLIDGVVITGGEPTMHDDLLEFIQKIKSMGFLIKLDSNGTRPEMIKQALDSNLVDYIAMDIKSPLESYSQQVARPVNTDAVRESISIIMNSSIEYEFRTTVVKQLLSEEAIESIAKSIAGAKRYYLQKFIPTKILNPQLLRKVSYSDDEFRILQQKIIPYVQYCGIR